MLRTRLVILGSVSALTLMAATTSQALQPPTMNFGLLKPLDQWKVGTVEARGAAYCAMVNRYNKQVVLAFARNPEGYSSLALDFRDSLFSPGAQYNVTLRPEDGQARSLSAVASSDRSVVVQIGQDDTLFKELAADGDLEVGLPTIDVAFALRRFSESYAELVDCAGQIPVAAEGAEDGEVEKDALASAVEDVAGDEAAKVVRRRDVEEKIAVAETEKQKDAEACVAEYAEKNERLNTELARVQRARDALSARAERADTDNKALKSQLVALQGQVAELKAQRTAQEAGLTKDLAETENAYKARLAALEGERDRLKVSLNAALDTSARQKAEADAREKDLAARLAAAEKLAKTAREKTSGLVTGLSGAEEEKRNLESRIDVLVRQKAEADRRQVELEARLDAAEKTARAVQEKTSGLATGLSGAEEEKRNLESRIDVLVRQKADADRRQGELEARAARLGEQNILLQAVLAARTGGNRPDKTPVTGVPAGDQVTSPVMAALEDVGLKGYAAQAPAAVALPVSPVTSEKLKSGQNETANTKTAAAANTRTAAAADTRTAAAAAVEPSAGEAEGIKPEDIIWAEATPAAPPSKAAKNAENKAEAFLDRIMAYHRPGAPEVPEADAADSVRAEVEEVDKVVASAPPVPSAPPVSREAEKPTLAAVQAGSSAVRADDLPPPLTAREKSVAPAVPVAPPPVQAAAAPVALDRLLSSAGMEQVTYLPSLSGPQGGEVRQWTAGRLTGMLEQSPAAGSFPKAVQDYLDRYRADCKSGLSVRLAPVRRTSTGALTGATAVCAEEGNAYSTSFTFLQAGASFSALVHTGLPGDADAVQKAGDAIARALSSSGGIALPKGEVPLAMDGGLPLPPVQNVTAGYAAPGDEDFETAIIQ